MSPTVNSAKAAAVAEGVAARRAARRMQRASRGCRVARSGLVQALRVEQHGRLGSRRHGHDGAVAAGQRAHENHLTVARVAGAAVLEGRLHGVLRGRVGDRKSTRLNSSHGYISYTV